MVKLFNLKLSSGLYCYVSNILRLFEGNLLFSLVFLFFNNFSNSFSVLFFFFRHRRHRRRHRVERKNDFFGNEFVTNISFEWIFQVQKLQALNYIREVGRWRASDSVHDWWPDLWYRRCAALRHLTPHRTAPFRLIE